MEELRCYMHATALGLALLSTRQRGKAFGHTGAWTSCVLRSCCLEGICWWQAEPDQKNQNSKLAPILEAECEEVMMGNAGWPVRGQGKVLETWGF